MSMRKNGNGTFMMLTISVGMNDFMQAWTTRHQAAKEHHENHSGSASPTDYWRSPDVKSCPCHLQFVCNKARIV
jgi:hypothetical protein